MQKSTQDFRAGKGRREEGRERPRGRISPSLGHSPEHVKSKRRKRLCWEGGSDLEDLNPRQAVASHSRVERGGERMKFALERVVVWQKSLK